MEGGVDGEGEGGVDGCESFREEEEGRGPAGVEAPAVSEKILEMDQKMSSKLFTSY